MCCQIWNLIFKSSLNSIQVDLNCKYREVLNIHMKTSSLVDAQVIVNDFFLGKQAQENGFVTVPLRDEFLENARLFIFETYCRIHQCIDIG